MNRIPLVGRGDWRSRTMRSLLCKVLFIDETAEILPCMCQYA
jgi:hypothetical protein